MDREREEEVWVEEGPDLEGGGWVPMVNQNGTTNQTWAVEMYLQLEALRGPQRDQ